MAFENEVKNILNFYGRSGPRWNPRMGTKLFGHIQQTIKKFKIMQSKNTSRCSGLNFLSYSLKFPTNSLNFLKYVWISLNVGWISSSIGWNSSHELGFSEGDLQVWSSCWKWIPMEAKAPNILGEGLELPKRSWKVYNRRIWRVYTENLKGLHP